MRFSYATGKPDKLGRLAGLQLKCREETMTENLIELDDHRDKVTRRAAEIRIRMQELQIDQELMQCRQEDLEELLLDVPAKTWREAAMTAQYLLQLFAATPEGQIPSRKKLIEQAFDDLARLCDDGQKKP